MSLIIVQMFLRGATLIMMLVAFFFNSEHYRLDAAGQFIKSGVYGSYAVVILGLICEVGLHITSDTFVEGSFLLSGVFFNLICATLSLTEFQKNDRNEFLDLSLLSLLTGVLFIVDLLLLMFLKKKT